MLGFQVLSTEQMRLEFVVEGLSPTALCLVRRIISEDWALCTQITRLSSGVHIYALLRPSLFSLALFAFWLRYVFSTTDQYPAVY
jgi:hypothetical protein